MNALARLENKSIHIIREAYRSLPNLAMLWSMGKDSTVMLYLARKSFFGHVPFPLIHIDTSFKIPEMISYRDRLAMDWKLSMIVGSNLSALQRRETFPDGNADRMTCCRLLKTEALAETLSGRGLRRRLDLKTGRYEVDPDRTPYNGVLVGIRADEEGTRAKERYFSPRGGDNHWDIEEQPAELWNQYKTDFKPGTHVRVHPLLDWREVDVWEYIEREKIPTSPLYYDHGRGKRYRSLGCAPCTLEVESSARNPSDIVHELKTGKFSDVAERSGRAQDKEDRGTLERLRREGYM